MKKIKYAKNIQSINLKTNKERKGQARFYPSVTKSVGETLSNYLIDLSRLKSWSYMQRQSLKSLISKNGDTSIYLLSGAVDKPVLLGKGKREILDFILPGIKQGVFDNQIRIYKDFDDESEKKEIDNLDVTDFKLDL